MRPMTSYSDSVPCSPLRQLNAGLDWQLHDAIVFLPRGYIYFSFHSVTDSRHITLSWVLDTLSLNSLSPIHGKTQTFSKDYQCEWGNIVQLCPVSTCTRYTQARDHRREKGSVSVISLSNLGVCKLATAPFHNQLGTVLASHPCILREE